ncbi:MAG: hypothetical protein V3R67_08760 [Thermodesulfobacteriota bacterium]
MSYWTDEQILEVVQELSLFDKLIGEDYEPFVFSDWKEIHQHEFVYELYKYSKKKGIDLRDIDVACPYVYPENPANPESMHCSCDVRFRAIVEHLRDFLDCQLGIWAWVEIHKTSQGQENRRVDQQY